MEEPGPKGPGRKGNKMTKTQERMVNFLHKEAERNCFDFEEIKSFEVDENKYFVSVYAIVGFVNDEDNPIMQYIGRRHVHVFVGKRGGMRCPKSKRLKNGKYIHSYFKYKGFYLTYMEQK